jgi:hypothetical protein
VQVHKVFQTTFTPFKVLTAETLHGTDLLLLAVVLVVCQFGTNQQLEQLAQVVAQVVVLLVTTHLMVQALVLVLLDKVLLVEPRVLLTGQAAVAVLGALAVKETGAVRHLVVLEDLA